MKNLDKLIEKYNAEQQRILKKPMYNGKSADLRYTLGLIHGVKNSKKALQEVLPELVTEDHGFEWIAYFNEVPGMVAVGETEELAIDAIMTSLKCKLLHDKK